MRYSYSGTGYANPHATTQIANGLSTTTYSYDNNGNLTSAGTGTATTSYSYDYANRLIAILYNNATTSTYGYDAFGARVYQISASTSAATTTYPFKFFSIASTTKSSTNFATSTEYVFNGDTLLATVDQAFKNGTATGTAQTKYVHPDHLGSTNVLTNASGTVAETLDYYPYGATRISSSVGGADSARKYIGQFADPSGLSYLNARFYNPNQGQFLSEEPIFLSIGDANQVKQLSQQEQQTYLADPQQLNSYSYGRDNPITRKDPNGKQAVQILVALGFSPEGVAAISYALDAYGTANLGVDAYNTYNTFRYTGGYTPTEKRQIYGQAVWDVVTGGASKLAKPIERSNLDTLTASLDVLNAASGGTVFNGRPQPTKAPIAPPIASFGSTNKSIPWSNYTTGPQQYAPSRVPQTGSGSAGYNAFPGLFNPFMPIIRPLVPSSASSQQK